MRPTIIDCKCGGENDVTTLKVRPLNPDVGNPVPLLEIEVTGSDKIYLDADGARELVDRLVEFIR